MTGTQKKSISCVILQLRASSESTVYRWGVVDVCVLGTNVRAVSSGVRLLVPVIRITVSGVRTF